MARASTLKALEKYREKRDFSKTAEPSGAARKAGPGKAQGHSFVVQRHAATRLHFDFRLELDGVLKSWAVTRGPSLDPHDKRLAVEVEDHPLEYGGFEGTIPKGEYGGGTVMLWDRGTWEPLEDPHDGLEKGNLKFNLYGERMKGRWVLVRMKPRGREAFAKNARNNWLLIKERDGEAREGEAPITETALTSVATGRTMDEIAAGAKVWHSNRSVKENVQRLETEDDPPPSKARRGAQMPPFVGPQLATLVDAPPKGKDWLHEIKYDGYRAIASVANGKAIIYTRKGLDWTSRFGAIAPQLASLPVKSAQFDGEIAVADKNGKTNFSALQAALSEGKPSRMTYYVFDLLELNGKDLRKEPLFKRKELLKKLIQKLKKPSQIVFSDGVAGDGEEVFENACKLGLEGIISKRLNAPYRSERTQSWLKVKCGMGQEFVIIGWQASDVKGRPFSSLLMGLKEGGALRYAGRVGSGFDERTLEQVSAQLKALEVKTPPIENLPPEARRKAHYAKPELVAEIAFRGWSSDGLIRQGSFKGLRTDKPAKEVTQERKSAVRMIENDKREAGAIEVEGVRITHPNDKIFAAEPITKRDLIDHYIAFAQPMLKHVARRPLSLVRFPDAEATKGFFQKHASPGFPDAFKTIPIKEKTATDDFLYIDTVAGLVAAAQVRAIELHIWGSHIDTLEEPDRIVFDFDPDPEVEWSAVKEAATEMRERLDALGIKSFLMATGGKGLHVIAPLKPRHSWPEIKTFTHALASVMAQDSPRKYTTILSKAKRRGRIFIDYLRNERSATAVAPYSPRAHKGAPIATPLAWSALAKLESAQPVTIKTAREKLKRDPWTDYFSIKQTLPLEKLTNSRS